MPKCTNRPNEGSSYTVIPWLLASAFLFLSCNTWRSFTTYFNVYYDAKRHLDIYEEKLSEPPPAQTAAIAVVTTHRWLDEEYDTRQAALKRGAELPPVKSSISGSTELQQRAGDMRHLDSAVILGSKILAAKNPTEYVEDALFIVGKALYYKKDFSGAKRKFNELLFKFPSTEYAPEVGRLLTRALLQTRQYDSAYHSIEKSVAASEATGTKNDKAQAHLLYADLLSARSPDSLSRAAEELEKAEQYSGDDESAKLAFERGALYYLDGKWDEAEKAFAASASRTSDAEIQGEARLAHSLALRRLLKFDEAKTELADVIEKVRYSNSHPPAQYELTYTIDLEARHRGKNILYDAAYRNKHYPAVREAYYVLDTTYRNISQAIMVRSRFRQAELFRSMGEYDSAARIANIIVGTKDFSTPEINDYVNARMRALTQFAEWRTTLTRSVKLEGLIERMRKNGGNIRETMENELRVMAERQVLGAEWRPDGEFTLTPEQQIKVKEAEVRIRKEREASGDPVSLLNIGDTTRLIDSLRMVQGKAHFELGRSYETFGEITNARNEYIQAYEQEFIKPDTAVKMHRARTLFTWIELEHQAKRFETRDSILSILQTSYGETVYAVNASRVYTGKGKDSPGEKAYEAAYARLKTGKLNAIEPLRQVSVTYKHEDVAPRALYAIGITYEEAGQFKEALEFYKRVVAEYPYSRYADELRPRLKAITENKNVIPANEIQREGDGSTVPENIPSDTVSVEMPPGQQPRNLPQRTRGTRPPVNRDINTEDPKRQK